MIAALKFAVLFLLGALALAGAVVLLLDGYGSAVVMFGFALACFAGAFLMRPAEVTGATPRIGSLTANGRALTGLIVTYSRRRLVLLILVGVGFLLVGGWMLVEGAVVVGVLLTAAFAILVATTGIALATGTGALVLTEAELVHASGGGRLSVRWDDIIEIERVRRRAPFIRVRSLTGTEVAPRLARAITLVFRRRDLELPLEGFGVDPEWLEELIRRCAEDPRERRRVASGASGAPGASPAASG